MRCSRVRERLIEFEDRELIPELQSHLDQCPACRQHREQMDFVRRLIALKKYERPAPGVEARCLAGIRRRLEQPDRTPEKAWGGVWEVLTGAPLPAFRYAVATAFAVLVAVHVLSLPQLPPVQPMLSEAAPAPLIAARSAAPSTNPPQPDAQGAGAAVLYAASNRGPAHLEYGPLPSTLVNFEY